MVRNFSGGHHKNQARKNVSGNTVKRLQLADNDEPDEIYGKVIANLGNRMFRVLCEDNVLRLGHIRGKFSGKGLFNNRITVGCLVLVGKRSWEPKRVIKIDATGKMSNLNNCDLLVVYDHTDINTLISKVKGKRLINLLSNEEDNTTEDTDVLFSSSAMMVEENVVIKEENVKVKKVELNENKIITLDVTENNETIDINNI